MGATVVKFDRNFIGVKIGIMIVSRSLIYMIVKSASFMEFIHGDFQKIIIEILTRDIQKTSRDIFVVDKV